MVWKVNNLVLDDMKKARNEDKNEVGLPKYKNMLGIVITIALKEGLVTLWNGQNQEIQVLQYYMFGSY